MALGTNPKEAGRLASKLKLEKWTDAYTTQGRRKQMTFHFINWKQVIHLIKYKIHMVSKRLEAMGSIQTSQFKCPFCEVCYSLLEVSAFEMNDEGFVCPVCSSLLTDMTLKSSATATTDKYSLFMSQIRPIVDLLRKTDDMTLPEVDIGDLERIYQSTLLEHQANARSAAAATTSSINGQMSGNTQKSSDSLDADISTLQPNDIVVEIVKSPSRFDFDPYSNHLASVNAFGAQQQDEKEEDSSRPSKRARVHESEEMQNEEEEDDEFVDVNDVNLVTVNGEYIPVHLITDEQKVIMTPEEFERYQAILSGQ